MLTPLLLTLLASAPQSARVEPPPGMVLVKGGRTTIGTSEEVVRELIAENGQDGKWAREYPEHRVDVPDFFLMVTEVTNEQYREFVRATGARPPELWGEAAIEAGRLAWAEEQYQKRQKAKEAGLIFEGDKWDPGAWWAKNWKDSEWVFPENLANHAVVYVDHPSAAAYARWAGLRLMTEDEFQRAARGDTTRIYPWGDDWKDGDYAHTVEARKDRSFPVGSWPKGAVNGIYDLCGGVWEWTSTPFEPYKGYKPLEIVEGKGRDKEKRMAIVEWQPDFRVSVGGSYKNVKTECRVTIRRSTDRFQTADALGFRCAATPKPGVDMANTVLREDLKPSMRPEGVSYDTGLTIAMDHWTSEERPGPPGYRVITGYDHLLFIPAESVDAGSPRELNEDSVEKGPIHLGVFATTQDATVPELKAGTYMLAYRGPGESRHQRRPSGASEASAAASDSEQGEQEPTADPAMEDPLAKLEFDREKPSLILYDVHGEPVLAIPTTEPKYDRPTAGRVSVEELQYTPEQMEKDPTLKPGDQITLHFTIAKSSTRGFEFRLPLLLRPNATKGWRY